MTLFAVVPGGHVPHPPPRPALVLLLARSRTRARCASGPTSRARSPGTSSPSPPTSPSRCSSGTWGSSPTSPPLRDASQVAGPPDGLRHLLPRLARLGPPLAALPSAYLLLAGLSTPLVLSVHTIVSFDFAISQLPGWHTTIFPPYFVAGAIFSGFAMVLTLMIPARKVFGLRERRHRPPPRQHGQGAPRHRPDGLLRLPMRVVHRLVLAGTPYERSSSQPGDPATTRWSTAIDFCNVVVPQILWLADGPAGTCWSCSGGSILVNVGMWTERFIIIARRSTATSSPPRGPTTSPPGSTGASRRHARLLRPALHALPALLPVIPMSEVKELAGSSTMRNTRGRAPGRGRRTDELRARRVQARAGALRRRAAALRGQGHRGLEPHTPYPIHGAEEALGLHRSTVPLWRSWPGWTGAASGYLMQYWYTVASTSPSTSGTARPTARPPSSPSPSSSGCSSRPPPSSSACSSPTSGFPAHPPPGLRGGGLPARRASTGCGCRQRWKTRRARRWRRRLLKLGAAQVAVVPPVREEP